MLTVMLTASSRRAKQQNERGKNLRRHVSEQGEASGVCGALFFILLYYADFPHNKP